MMMTQRAHTYCKLRLRNRVLSYYTQPQLRLRNRNPATAGYPTPQHALHR